MATFNINIGNTILRGTNDADTVHLGGQFPVNLVQITSAGGNDFFDGKASFSYLDGGTGGDTFIIERGFANRVFGGDDGDNITSVAGQNEFLTGQDGDDIMFAIRDIPNNLQSLFNTLDGGEGDDTISTDGFANTLNGGNGIDKLNIILGADENTLNGGNGDDVLRAFADGLNVCFEFLNEWRERQRQYLGYGSVIEPHWWRRT